MHVKQMPRCSYCGGELIDNECVHCGRESHSDREYDLNGNVDLLGHMQTRSLGERLAYAQFLRGNDDE